MHSQQTLLQYIYKQCILMDVPVAWGTFYKGPYMNKIQRPKNLKGVLTYNLPWG